MPYGGGVVGCFGDGVVAADFYIDMRLRGVFIS